MRPFRARTTLLLPPSGIKAHGTRFRVHGPGFIIQGSEFRVQGSGVGVLGFEFRV
jgi:hypothetical protein